MRERNMLPRPRRGRALRVPVPRQRPLHMIQRPPPPPPPPPPLTALVPKTASLSTRPPAAHANFACRACRKLYHRGCVGYSGRSRQSPPPDWICPHCPGGERGPSLEHLHRSVAGKGTVKQPKGNMPWCPICLRDDRMPNSQVVGDGSKCPGCGMNIHAPCLEGLPVGPDGKWPCDECRRRTDGGFVPGDNPAWLRLTAARAQGGKGLKAIMENAAMVTTVTPPTNSRPAVSHGSSGSGGSG
ncbi:unnamed protein product, partial [Ectocarpus fasciculatus]